MSDTQMPPGPTLSVVVATGADVDALRQLLAVVEPCCRARAAELVVVKPGSEHLEELRAEFPAVVFAHGPENATPALLRSVGAVAASGDIIILSDDVRPLPEEWLTINAS